MSEVLFMRLSKSIGDIPSMTLYKKTEIEKLKCRMNLLQKKVEELEVTYNKEETEKYNKLKEWGRERMEWNKEKILLLDMNQKYIKILEQLISSINSLQQ